MTRRTSRAMLPATIVLCLALAVTASAIGGAAVAVATLVAQGVTPPDAWDAADDTIAGATAVSWPTTQRHALALESTASADFDLDLFRVEMTAGHVYRVTAAGCDAGGNPADPMIDVFKVSEVESAVASLPLTAPLLDPDDPFNWPSLMEFDDRRTDTGTAEAYYSSAETTAFYVLVQDGYGSRGGEYDVTFADEGPLPPGTVSRVDGIASYGVSDRYSVAAALAEKVGRSLGATFPANVIIASGLDKAAADPLSAGSLAGALNAPILLVRGDVGWLSRLPASTATYLQRLRNAKAPPISFSIVGGPASVPESLKAVVLKYAPAGSRFVARYTGADRYVVAAAVAAKVRSISGTSAVCFVANGQVPAYFYDALATSALAAKMRYPILLTKSSVVPAPTAAEVARYRERIVVGNISAIGVPTASALKATRRVGYDVYVHGWAYNRQHMARLVAEYGRDRGWIGGAEVGLANRLADSLVGGAAMGRLGGGLLFSDAGWMDTELTEGPLDQLRPYSPHVYVVGGTASVTPAVIDRVGLLVGAAP